jgi:hypothetical protein
MTTIIFRDAGRPRAALFQACAATARKVAMVRASVDSTGSVAVSVGIVASQPRCFVWTGPAEK